LGLAYLGAVARRAGHEVRGVEGILIGDPDRIAAQVAAVEPDVIGTNTVTQDRLASVAMIRRIRAACPNAFIVVGGSHYSHSAIDALETLGEIDAVVMGEGEQTFLELLDHLPGREGFSEIRGLAWRDRDGAINCNEPRSTQVDLDSLPMPAWDLFAPRLYDHRAGRLRADAGDGAASLITGVMTSRGCPQSCVFCANGGPTRVRFMSPERAVDQFQWLAWACGVTGLDIFDDNFYASEAHVVALCEEMLRRDCRLTWWAGARLKNLNADVLGLMKRAGCRSLSFGVETGTDEVLGAIAKHITTAEMLEAMETVAQVGFDRVGIFLILGLPGETTETIDRTIAFIRKLRDIVGPDAWDVDSLIGELPLIFPGTALEPLGRIEGCLGGDFSWHQPYRDPDHYLPLVNRRYDTVPHFQTRSLPLAAICDHIRKHHWSELSAHRKRRYRYAPLHRVKAAFVG